MISSSAAVIAECHSLEYSLALLSAELNSALWLKYIRDFRTEPRARGPMSDDTATQIMI